MKVLALAGYSLVVASYLGDVWGTRAMAAWLAILAGTSAVLAWLARRRSAGRDRRRQVNPEPALRQLRSLRRKGLISSQELERGRASIIRHITGRR
jgi:hypothetical protein